MLKDDNVDQIIRDFIRNQQDIIIDRYSDEGGNCEMYFGTRKIFNDRVALKFYYSSIKVESHDEPRILKSIEHPNVLRVWDAKVISSTYSYFLTPEISGGDLKKHIDTNIIDTSTALDIIVGILDGLTVLHNKPNYIVHRDLKPKNILLDSATKTPIISDFGSIKAFDKTIGSVKASKCTHIYRPKEAILEEKYTTQSDLYQVGLILFQLLGGRFPDIPIDWLNDKQKQKFNSILGNFEQWQFIEGVLDKLIISNRLIDLDSLPIFTNDMIKKVIKTAIHPNLSKRYKTTSEFINDIYKIQKKLINYWIENETIYAKTKKHIYKCYQEKKSYTLESSKDGNIWRKDNSHAGTLESIIKKIEY